MSKKFKVYCHTCPDNTKYIGITSQHATTRWRKQGIGYVGQRFYSAIEKFGWDNITHEILHYNLTEKEAFEKEIQLIEQYNTTDPLLGWNSVIGGSINRVYGERNTNYKKHWFTDGVKNIMDYECPEGFWKGKTDSIDTKKLKQVANSRKRKPLTEEHKQKIKESQLGKKISVKTKQALLNSHIGISIPTEQRKKMSESAKGRFWITDGKNMKSAFKEDDIPIGWTKGYIKKKSKNLYLKKSIIDYIQIIYKKEILFNHTINDVIVDLYFPKKKIAIDLRGWYWDMGDSKELPKLKTKMMKDNNIRLITIYDYEWFGYTDNFKKFLYYTLNSRDKRLIRSNKIKEINNEEFIDFLKENHLFADTIKGCTVMYGIYEGDELVAVSGFNRKNRKYNWEWKRFAIKYGWMSQPLLAQLFLDEFSKEHKGILVDYQQMDRFPFSTDETMGFINKGWNTGVVSINKQTLNFTRHDFIPEKPLNKLETMLKYGFDETVTTAGTITWVKEII